MVEESREEVIGTVEEGWEGVSGTVEGGWGRSGREWQEDREEEVRRKPFQLIVLTDLHFTLPVL